MYKLIREKLKNHYHLKRMINKWRELNKHNSTYLVWIPRDDEFFSRVTVGNFTYGPINAIYSYHPNEKLVIGNFCSIGGGTKFILGSEHPYRGISTFPFKVKCIGESFEAQTKGPIILEDDVWLGEDVLVLSGVTIGKGAVVAAGSIVVKNIPPYAIVGGNPAKIIKYRFDQEVIDILMKVDLAGLDQSQIKANINILNESLNAGNVKTILKQLKLID